MNELSQLLLGTILGFTTLIYYIIVADVIMGLLHHFKLVDLRISFLNKLYWLLHNFTSPMYRKVRQFIPSFGGLDFSPIVVILGLNLIEMLATALLK